MDNRGNIVIYQTKDGKTSIDVKLENETVWLTQAQMAFVGYDGKWRLEKGDFKIKCGDQWMDIVCDQTKVWNTPNKNTLHK